MGSLNDQPAMSNIYELYKQLLSKGIPDLSPEELQEYRLGA